MKKPKLRIYIHNDKYEYTPDPHLSRIVIGRAPSSQIILNDESISSNHAYIENREGQYFIVDNKSLNALLFKGAKIQERKIEQGDIFYLGKAKIEVLELIPLWENTKEINVETFWNNHHSSKKYFHKRVWLIATGFFILFLSKVMETLFTNPVAKGEWGNQLISILGHFLISLFLSLLFSMISKNQTKTYQFPRISSIVSLTFSAMVFYSFLYPYFFAIFFLTPFIHSTYKLIFYFIMGGGIYFLSQAIFPEWNQKKVLWGIVSTLLISSLTYLLIQMNMENYHLKKYRAHLFYPLFEMKNFSLPIDSLESQLMKDLEKGEKE